MEKMSLLMILLGLATYAQAGIKIMHPPELKMRFGKDGLVKSSLGNFGHIVYGTSIVSYLFFA
jgi:hypothetical protein